MKDPTLLFSTALLTVQRKLSRRAVPPIRASQHRLGDVASAPGSPPASALRLRGRRDGATAFGETVARQHPCLIRRDLRCIARARAASPFWGFLLLLSPALGQECTQTLSPGANVASAVSSAPPGSTICLNNGSYSGFTLNGVSKNPRVTVRAANPLGASFTGTLTFSGNTNGLTFDGFHFTGITITGESTRELTFRNYNQSGKFLIDGVTTATPNILLENFTHNNVTAAEAPNARINFSFSGRSTPVATIRGATIDGGCADGIQSGVPFIIEYSTLKNMQVGSCPNDPHTDALQLYGGPFAGTIIRNNYFYRNVQVLSAYDGVDGVLIENNIFDPGPDGERRPCQIELYSDANSIIRHNTVLARGSQYGHICLDRKSADDAGYGTIVVDNIANSIQTANGSTYAQRTNNLLLSGAIASEINGSPTYVGGPAPTTIAGFELASNSAGKGAASSPVGSDIGVNTSTLSLPPTDVLPVPANLRIAP